MSSNDWVKFASVVVRKGLKDGWYEVILTRENGSEVKMIASPVERFWSEKKEPKKPIDVL
jgi:hypothetical protein